jgi:cell division protein FtsB
LLQLKEVKKEEKSKLKLLEAEITKIRAEIKKIENKMNVGSVLTLQE